ncbi:hypothetical protein B0182_06845 [Moraxella bovis]|nr:hypothetical protein DQF64_04410 [Moraxella bovis]OOR89861.1 hypothetical protein B0182_06845 [Moraxella bovis]
MARQLFKFDFTCVLSYALKFRFGGVLCGLFGVVFCSWLMHPTQIHEFFMKKNMEKAKTNLKMIKFVYNLICLRRVELLYLQ